MFVLLPYASLLPFPEGFLTTCSFDFLTDDEDTKVFVTCIFIWAYVIPLIFIILFYSRLLSSIRNHEKMLREQVRISNIFNIINQLFLRNVIIPALKRTVYSFAL